MSTIYTFHEECTALGAVPAGNDELLLYDTSAGATKNVTAALLLEGARTVTSGSTAASLNGYGITLAPSTAAVLTLADPTQAGQETTILFPSSTSTRSVAPAAATILGTTGAPSGGSKLTVTGTTGSPSASVTLVAATTAIWYAKAVVGPVTCT